MSRTLGDVLKVVNKPRTPLFNDAFEIVSKSRQVTYD